ncbi:DUF6455 family protein [Ruegeria sp. HKCCA5491]|uniref:DUF6455 family protein n=1 Tax=Ruegeria sp. HKCCA5491 TaxID=2682986 RepID=UPI001488F9E1|nr:DUF6455 family protein [Ruegeria sp. HKCCA5491]
MQDVLGDIEKHFWLTRSVARSLDVSLTEAIADKQISPTLYAEMVTRCRASPCTERCMAWLAERQTTAKSAPKFCANADILNSLKK